MVAVASWAGEIFHLVSVCLKKKQSLRETLLFRGQCNGEEIKYNKSPNLKITSTNNQPEESGAHLPGGLREKYSQIVSRTHTNGLKAVPASVWLCQVWSRWSRTVHEQYFSVLFFLKVCFQNSTFSLKKKNFLKSTLTHKKNTDWSNLWKGPCKILQTVVHFHERFSWNIFYI